MPTIMAKSDDLNALNGRYAQRPLQVPLFLNSVPKSGTHLLRNIVRMFVPITQQYHATFVQLPILHKHLRAFYTESPMVSWGHLLFSDESAIALAQVQHIVLVRDPYDWVLARARFFLSDTFKGDLDHLKDGRVAIDEVLNMMIFGIHGKSPSLKDIYTHNAAAWLGTKATVIKFEDLVASVNDLASVSSERFFADLFSLAGLGNLPADWAERVSVGSDPKQSGTARENLAGLTAIIPDVLPNKQKELVDYAVPGLRALLGYRH